MSGSAVFGVHVIDDESPHIVKRPQNAGASWSIRVNPDWFENKLVHKRPAQRVMCRILADQLSILSEKPAEDRRGDPGQYVD